MLKETLSLLLAAGLAPAPGAAQDPAPDAARDAFIESQDFLARGGGKWKGSNRDYAPENGQPKFWGLEFEWAAGRHAVRGRILGIHADGHVEELWTMLTAWDPARRIGVHFQVSAAGVFADGQLLVTTEKLHQVLMRGYTRDHKRFTMRDTARVLGPDEMETTSSYLAPDGAWQDEAPTRWKRVSSYTEG